MYRSIRNALALLGLAGPAAGTLVLGAAPLAAQAFEQHVRNDMSVCRGQGPAVLLNLAEVKNARGTMRVNLYRGTDAEWLASGKWLNRIEIPARQGRMTFCMPVPRPGVYAIAIRHDVNDNDKTDITVDGGAMSNNPSINIFNLGKPSYTKVRFDVGNEVVTMNLRMRYL